MLEQSRGLHKKQYATDCAYVCFRFERKGHAVKIAMAISGPKMRSVFEGYNIVSANDILEAGRKLGRVHGSKVEHISNTIEDESETNTLQ